jgi:predicted MFS family arabinose efflux permease
LECLSVTVRRNPRPGSGELRRQWKVAAAGFCGNALGVGALLYFGLGSFVKPMEQSLGWNRLQINVAATIFTLTSMLALPVVGRLCDSLGPRRVVLPSILALAVGIALIALGPANLNAFYAEYLLCSLLGAGTLGLTYAAAVSSAFDARRGLALGISLSGAGVAAFALPLLLRLVIEAHGWRAAWMALALVALLQWPIAAVLLPGSSDRGATKSAADGHAQHGLLLLLRTRRFWLMTLPFFLVALFMSGYLVNLVALLSDRGLSAAEAAATASLVGIGILIARLLVGFLLDVTPARWLAAIVFTSSAAGALCLLESSPASAAVGAFLFGFTAGAEYDLLAFMASRYFRGPAQNAVLGASLSLFNAGAVLSPLLAGGLYQAGGSYSRGLLLVVPGCLVAAAIVSCLGSYPESAVDPDAARSQAP